MPQDNSIPLQAFNGDRPIDNYLKGLHEDQQAKRAEQQGAMQDKLGQQTLQMNDMKMHQERLSALNDILSSVPDGDAQALEVAKQRALSNPNLGLKPEDVANFTIADLPGLKIKTGQAAQMLDMQLKRAQIGAQRANTAQSYASADAAKAMAEQRRTMGGMAGGKPPNGYRFVQGADGSMVLEPIPGGPADPSTKPLTDEQAKALGFANRVKETSAILSSPDAVGAQTNSFTQGLSAIPFAGNYLAGQNNQQAEQATRDFINAVLRRESGAAISSSEFDNAYKQYIPQPGDKPLVIAQKERARQQALQNLLLSAGPSSRPAASQAAPGATAAPAGNKPSWAQ